MKHYKLVEFLSNLNVKPPCTNVKPPRTNVKPPLTTFWRWFCWGPPVPSDFTLRMISLEPPNKRPKLNCVFRNWLRR